jgi:hypothetical protein
MDRQSGARLSGRKSGLPCPLRGKKAKLPQIFRNPAAPKKTMPPLLYPSGEDHRVISITLPRPAIRRKIFRRKKEYWNSLGISL